MLIIGCDFHTRYPGTWGTRRMPSWARINLVVAAQPHV
jgi:hypothetical protein